MSKASSHCRMIGFGQLRILLTIRFRFSGGKATAPATASPAFLVVRSASTIPSPVAARTLCRGWNPMPRLEVSCFPVRTMSMRRERSFPQGNPRSHARIRYRADTGGKRRKAPESAAGGHARTFRPAVSRSPPPGLPMRGLLVPRSTVRGFLEPEPAGTGPAFPTGGGAIQGFEAGQCLPYS